MGAVLTIAAALPPVLKGGFEIVQIVKQLISDYQSAPKMPIPVASVGDVTPEELRSIAHVRLGIDTINQYNFAFVGCAGVGKSSLINALRNIDDHNPLASKVSHGVEGTTEILHFHHPTLDHIVFWDTPGCGTIGHPSSTYFEDKMLYAFDCLIIVGEERFAEVDSAIAEAAQSFGVPFVFVRSKMDQMIKNEWRLYPDALVEDVKKILRDRIINNISLELNKTKVSRINRRIFLISSPCFRDQKDAEIFLMDELELIKEVGSISLNRRNGVKCGEHK